ncbi:unnamed protein product [Closterium sp. NIES-65]|nr:unnamed protein product [Closterium sp. NIES-65]
MRERVRVFASLAYFAVSDWGSSDLSLWEEGSVRAHEGGAGQFQHVCGVLQQRRRGVAGDPPCTAGVAAALFFCSHVTLLPSSRHTCIACKSFHALLSLRLSSCPSLSALLFLPLPPCASLTAIHSLCRYSCPHLSAPLFLPLPPCACLPAISSMRLRKALFVPICLHLSVPGYQHLSVPDLFVPPPHLPFMHPPRSFPPPQPLFHLPIAFALHPTPHHLQLICLVLRPLCSFLPLNAPLSLPSTLSSFPSHSAFPLLTFPSLAYCQPLSTLPNPMR